MSGEISILLNPLTSEVSRSDYLAAITESNAFDKPTAATRQLTAQRLARQKMADAIRLAGEGRLKDATPDKAHAAQDRIEFSGGGKGPCETPNWDLADLGKASKPLSDLVVMGFDFTYAFGSKDEVRPVDHLVGAAAGWGGLPVKAAYDELGAVDANDGETPHAVTVKDVPVDAFWSCTLYDTQNGFFIPNDRKKYSVGENGGMKLNEDEGIEIYISAEKPEGVPEENWLPLNRGDYGIDVVLRLYVPDLEKYKNWELPKAEKLN